jgi:hypothetical protein
MKNKIILLFILFSGLTIISGCRKYPDGPSLSLRSRAERVTNTWKVDSYKKNGSDFTFLYANYHETFTKEGNYSYSWGSVSGTGLWAFQNNDTQIKITGIKLQSSQTLYILKLEEKEFWYYYFDGDDRKEFHLVQF